VSAGTWQQDAVCREVDPELFFPLGEGGAAAVQAEEAKAVCHTCPVMGACLDSALAHGNPEGIWGGTTETERKSIRRSRGQYGRERDLEPCGTQAAARRHYRRGETLDAACREANRLAQMEKAEAASS
jgi:WhiB family redox-sensing transcriptional regulator